MNALLIPLIIFATATCITPGPNNIMLTSSGANFGFKRTIPHILGIAFGLIALMASTAAGLGILLRQFPEIQFTLKVVGCIYLLFLSWKIATIAPVRQEKSKSRPLTFFEAVLFQFLNPKALVMAFSAISAFTIAGRDYIPSVIQVTLVFFIICIPAISFWAGFGVAIGRLLNTPHRFRVFNLSLGTLTASSVVFIIF